MIRAARCAEKSEIRAETAGECQYGVLEVTGWDEFKLQLTFSPPVSPPRGRFQELCPLGFTRSDGRVRQPGKAGCEKEEEAG